MKINRVKSGIARRMAGMSMIEVLITLVIVSFGLLGVAALQIMSLQVNQGANQRSQASMLAVSVLDSIRGNRANAAAYARNYGAAVPVFNAPLISDQELSAIVSQVRRVLPNGDVQVAVVTQEIDIGVVREFYDVTISVRWSEADRMVDRTSTAAAEPTEFVLQSRI